MNWINTILAGEGASETFSKLRSDRLWALLAFVGLVVGNSVYDLGLEVTAEGQSMSELSAAMWATMTFILGKSVRGTVGGSMLQKGTDIAITAIDSTLPKVPPEEDDQ